MWGNNDGGLVMAQHFDIRIMNPKQLTRVIGEEY